MIKPLHVCSLLILSLSILGLFQVKYHVQTLRDQLAEIERQTILEEEVLHILKAEWSYLNKPERLRKLVNQYLNDLNSIQIAQLSKLDKNLPILTPALPTLYAAPNYSRPNIVPASAVSNDELLREVKELMGINKDEVLNINYSR